VSTAGRARRPTATLGSRWSPTWRAPPRARCWRAPSPGCTAARAGTAAGHAPRASSSSCSWRTSMRRRRSGARIFAVTADPVPDNYIAYSDDDGASFTPLVVGARMQSVRVAPSDASRVFAAGFVPGDTPLATPAGVLLWSETSGSSLRDAECAAGRRGADPGHHPRLQYGCGQGVPAHRDGAATREPTRALAAGGRGPRCHHGGAAAARAAWGHGCRRRRRPVGHRAAGGASGRPAAGARERRARRGGRGHGRQLRAGRRDRAVCLPHPAHGPDRCARSLA
jgi:hypothetical protein